MSPLLEQISVDPNVGLGKPRIRGTRIWVSLILDFLANGAGIGEPLEQYPQLEEEDIRATLAYGAEMARERYVEIPTERDARIHREDTTSCSARPKPPLPGTPGGGQGRGAVGTAGVCNGSLSPLRHRE